MRSPGKFWTGLEPVVADRQRHAQALRLMRWLGPWANPHAMPSGVTRRAIGPDGPRGYLYRPDGPCTGAYVVAQGLHYDGPDDPRMDRFCRVLASAGIAVVAPFLDDYLRLVLSPRPADDVAAAVAHTIDLCAAEGWPPPGLFSISFGSAPVLRVAADARFRDRIGGVVLFGGFFDFDAVVRFAVTGRMPAAAHHVDGPIELPYDPQNAPAVFINLLPWLDARGDPAPLAAAWLDMARRTWGRPHLRPAHERSAIADDIVRGLPVAQRSLFRIGCGLERGGEAFVDEVLGAAVHPFAYMDPAPHLRELRGPVVVAHGRDDDVIPWPHASALCAALPPAVPHRLMLTGLYGHTGSRLPTPGAIATEVQTMLALVYALIDAPRAH